MSRQHDSGRLNDLHARQPPWRTGRPPWETGQPQPAFAAFAALAGVIRGRVLDVGCGTGEHPLMAAARGLDATGIAGWLAAVTRI